MKNELFNALLNKLEEMRKSEISKEDFEKLNALEKAIHKTRGVSDHFKWCFEVTAEKFKSMTDFVSGAKPYEVVTFKENIVLDVGREEIIKLLIGDGGTAYNNANAKIYVGDNATAENASQTGVLATINKAYANMVAGYPKRSGGSATFQGVLGDDVANFEIKEISVSNGTGVGSVALNRRVADLGRKAQGTTWNVTATITLLSA